MPYECDVCPAKWDYDSSEEFFTIEKRFAGPQVRGDVVLTICRRCFARALLHLPFDNMKLREGLAKIVEREEYRKVSMKLLANHIQVLAFRDCDYPGGGYTFYLEIPREDYRVCADLRVEFKIITDSEGGDSR